MGILYVQYILSDVPQMDMYVLYVYSVGTTVSITSSKFCKQYHYTRHIALRSDMVNTQLTRFISGEL
jgi:hypothetical protein